MNTSLPAVIVYDISPDVRFWTPFQHYPLVQMSQQDHQRLQDYLAMTLNTTHSIATHRLARWRI